MRDMPHGWSLARLLCAGLLVSGCASSRSPETDMKQVHVSRGDSAGSSGLGPVAGAPSEGSDECLGPGRYERGKGSPNTRCCAGLHEVPTGKSGYRGDSTGSYEPSCELPPLYVFACVRGSCGDGVCEEEGEAPACGCVEDCPQAAFTWADTARLGQMSGAPASCKRADLLQSLQLPAAAKDCGDLPLAASPADRDASIACARDAIAAARPFRVFWRTVGVDSVVHSGVIGRLEGGALRLFWLYVDADVFGINIPGATASWASCTIGAPSGCESSPKDCLGCAEAAEDVVCGCLPKGERPGKPPGSSVELRCERL